MLPAPETDGPSLADVLRSCLESISGSANRLSLPAVDSAIVLLIDGLGAEALRARAGHARTLAGAMGKRDVIVSGFPTTTAAALASLTTGLPPGQHGLVGYSVRDAENDRMVNQLTGWDDRLDPQLWQPFPTIFETALERGLTPYAIGQAKFADSGFTRAVLRGARYLDARSIGARLELATERAGRPGSLVYVYVPELDQAGHAHGGIRLLERARELRRLPAVRAAVANLGPRTGMLVTADHGMIDIPATAHVLVDAVPELMAGVRFVAGEPRCLQLHLDPSADAAALAAAWREVEGDRAWIATRQEAIAAGWFGEVREQVVARLKELGFTYVTLDLQGFRSGSMNEVLKR